jgi:hypothetical protein
MKRHVLIYGGFRKRFYYRVASIFRTRYCRNVRQFPKVQTMTSLGPTTEGFCSEATNVHASQIPLSQTDSVVDLVDRGIKLTDTLYVTLCTFRMQTDSLVLTLTE